MEANGLNGLDGPNNQMVMDLIEHAVWASRYDTAIRLQPECAAGWGKKRAQHLASVRALANEIAAAPIIRVTGAAHMSGATGRTCRDTGTGA